MGGVSLCPCCGGKVDPERFLADLNTNTVSLRGKAMRATPQVVELLFILGRKSPAVVRLQELICEVIGLREVKNPEVNMRVLISNARRLGKVMGFEITGIRTIGYRLKFDPPPAIRLIA